MYNLTDCEFKKTTLCFLEKKMPDQAVAAQQLGKFIERFSEYVLKSETLFITQKLQLPIGLSVRLYLFI